VNATLRGSPQSPRLDLRIALREVAGAGVVLLLLREEALRDVRTALGVARLRTVVRMGFTDRGPEAPGRGHRRGRKLA
jgi:hypothetical protein